MNAISRQSDGHRLSLGQRGCPTPRAGRRHLVYPQKAHDGHYYVFCQKRSGKARGCKEQQRRQQKGRKGASGAFIGKAPDFTGDGAEFGNDVVGASAENRTDIYRRIPDPAAVDGGNGFRSRL